MELSDLLKIVLTQALVIVAAVGLAYLKLRQDFQLNREKNIADHRLERLRQQLAEFYAPLHMLSLTARELVGSTWDTPEWDKAFKDGLLPLHEQMESILLNKAHLMDETTVPDSFVKFLCHIRTVRCYKESGLTDSYFKREEEFPKSFNRDIARAYCEKREQYMDEFAIPRKLEPSQAGYPE